MNLPVTRYYGSKRRLLDKIWDALSLHQIEFDSMLDLFGGTAIVSYYMAQKGKNIIYNIDRGKVNLEIGVGKNWEFEKRINYINELDELIYKHRDSIIALSYTTEGYPSIQELEEVIHRYKQTTHVCYLGKHGFALNRNNAERQEVLIIGL